MEQCERVVKGEQCPAIAAEEVEGDGLYCREHAEEARNED